MIAVKKIERAIQQSVTETHDFHGPNMHHIHCIHILIRPLASSRILEPHWFIFERRAGYLHASSVRRVECKHVILGYAYHGEDVRCAGTLEQGGWTRYECLG